MARICGDGGGGCSPARCTAQIGAQPIRIIFPFAAGGSGDTVSRLIAAKMSDALGRPVIVENRTGADGRIGVQRGQRGRRPTAIPCC